MTPETIEALAANLVRIAAGLRDGTLELDNVEESAHAHPVPKPDGTVEYRPTGHFTLVMAYKQKDA